MRRLVSSGAAKAATPSEVRFDDPGDLGRIYVCERLADLVERVADRDGLAVGRAGHDDDVVQFAQAGRVVAVNLDEDAFRAAQVGGRSAHAGGEVDAAVGVEIDGLDDGEVDLA
jgi:hypothetical protein